MATKNAALLEALLDYIFKNKYLDIFVLDEAENGKKDKKTAL